MEWEASRKDYRKKKSHVLSHKSLLDRFHMDKDFFFFFFLQLLNIKNGKRH
jgi:hypothetical protein